MCIVIFSSSFRIDVNCAMSRCRFGYFGYSGFSVCVLAGVHVQILLFKSSQICFIFVIFTCELRTLDT